MTHPTLRIIREVRRLFAVYRKTADAHRIRPLVQHLAAELHKITS